MATGYQVTSDEASAPLLRWSAVFGGLILGLALLLLLSTLCLALAYGSNVSSVAANIEWYIGASAVLSLFVAGILTGYLSGVRGAGTGMLHGFALWGLLIVATITIGIPSVLNVFGLRQIADQAIGGRPVGTVETGALWVSFWTIVGGFVAAGLGGMIGGLATRSARREMVAVAGPTPGPAAAPPAPTQIVVPDTAEIRDDRSSVVGR